MSRSRKNSRFTEGAPDTFAESEITEDELILAHESARMNQEQPQESFGDPVHTLYNECAEAAARKECSQILTRQSGSLNGPGVLVPQIISSSRVVARDLASMARRDDAGNAGALSRNRNEASGVRAPPEPGTNLWSAALASAITLRKSESLPNPASSTISQPTPSQRSCTCNIISHSRSPVIGIDLGSTYSKIAFIEGNQVVLLRGNQDRLIGHPAIPSAVYYPSDGGCVTGAKALAARIHEPERVVTSFKRLLGQSPVLLATTGFRQDFSCMLCTGPDDSLHFTVDEETISVTDVCAAMLDSLASLASDQLGAHVCQAVLTVPVDLNELGRQQLRRAAQSVGINVLQMLSEPVAAGYTVCSPFDERKIIAVVDFGGDTLDVCLLETHRGEISILAAAGDRRLGGRDYDELLAQIASDEFFRISGHRLECESDVIQMRYASEEAKRRLSSLEATDIIIPRSDISPGINETLNVPVTQLDFTKIGERLTASAIDVCHRVLETSGVRLGDIDELLLTGGMTLIPSVQKVLEEYFQQRAKFGSHPGQAVASGAALLAAQLEGRSFDQEFFESFHVERNSRVAIGLALADGTMDHLIRIGERLPSAAHRTYSMWYDDLTVLTLELLLSESNHISKSILLGRFIIDRFPPRKAGVVTLDVYFELNSNDVLNVVVQERQSGRRQEATFDVSISASLEICAA